MSSRGPYRRHWEHFKLQLCQEIHAGRLGWRDVRVRGTGLELSAPCDNDHVQLTNSWTRWERRAVASAGAPGQS